MFPSSRSGIFRLAAHKIQTRVYNWLGSPSFFYVILGLLAVQALWIALTARYPQAFDENVHFGLIQLHAEQWLPFFTGHIPGGEVFGPIARDPSYFFHYLLSIPYRFISSLTDSTAIQVIILRLINTAFFIGGLFVYRKLLLVLGVSRRMMHTVLFFFVLTPIVPLLAAQINYDNLIFLLTGVTLWYAVRFLVKLRTEGLIDVQSLLCVTFYILFASIVKYTSTPLSLALIFTLVIMTYLTVGKSTKQLKDMIRWPKKTIVVSTAVLIVLMAALFAERYAVNLAQHQSPSPDCAKVLTIEQCQAYSPWARDYYYANNYPKPSVWGVVVYPFVWIHRMVFETMFVISSYFMQDGVRVEYVVRPPLTVANYTAWFLVLAGFGLIALHARRLWQMTYMRLLLLAILFYVFVLFLKNMSMYLHTGEAMAIHGRYLIPVFPVLYAALALPFGWLLEKRDTPAAKTWFVIVTALLFVHGAGLIAWLFRSDSLWYWPEVVSPLPYHINQFAQDIIHKVIIP